MLAIILLHILRRSAQHMQHKRQNHIHRPILHIPDKIMLDDELHEQMQNRSCDLLADFFPPMHRPGRIATGMMHMNTGCNGARGGGRVRAFDSRVSHACCVMCSGGTAKNLRLDLGDLMMKRTRARRQHGGRAASDGEVRGALQAPPRVRNNSVSRPPRPRLEAKSSGVVYASFL